MAATPAKKTSTPTVTLKHLASQLSDRHELSKKQADAMLNDLVTLVVKHLKKGDRIRLSVASTLGGGASIRGPRRGVPGDIGCDARVPW